MPNNDSEAASGRGRRTFDGIICIGGEDWWYHNRGHFDFQIMRRLAKRWPVLFVNSLGVRVPSLRDNRQFATRILRKLKSLGNGLVNVEDNFWVFSPVMVPGAAGQAISSWALRPQIKLAASRLGIKNPMLWMHCPAGEPLASNFGAVAIVLQRTDRFEAFPEADSAVVGRQIARLKSAADLVVYANSELMASEKISVRRQLLVTHGVDLETFAAVGRTSGSRRADVSHIGHPRVGFIGGIDDHTFDVELFLGVARSRPDYQFVMVGDCSLPEGWCGLRNVHFIGRQPYDQVASYMAAMNVLIMPWNRSEWIKACNPIKLKEYLAVGRPVVTTDFPALDAWREYVHVATGSEAFAEAIDAALASGSPNVATLHRLLVHETWDAKADLIRRAIFDLGLAFADNRSGLRGAA